jgi:hypothetical protein
MLMNYLNAHHVVYKGYKHFFATIKTHKKRATNERFNMIDLGCNIKTANSLTALVVSLSKRY